MKFNIISDSCCDFSKEMQKSYDVSIAPLSLTIDGKLFLDGELLEMEHFMKEMKKSSKMTSGAPSPGSFLDKIKKDATNFIVTLSEKLSGTFASAIIAKQIAEEDNCDVHVIDSKSASAGQMLTILKLKDIILSTCEKSQIIAELNSFINNMKTYFVSQDLSNFVKNGRLSKLKGTILTTLGIRPILGSDGNGNIALFSHARGDNQTLTRFIDLIKNSGKNTDGQDMVISHCNNSDLALRLKDKVEQTFKFREIIVSETRGLSSMYASDKGIIIAF